MEWVAAGCQCAHYVVVEDLLDDGLMVLVVYDAQRRVRVALEVED